jgi:hypothetical protein
MISKSKFVIAPLLLALSFSMAACGDPASSETGNTGTISYEGNSGESVSPESTDNTGGIGMTYNGKLGIDLGGGLVMPMGGGTPQIGIGF